MIPGFTAYHRSVCATYLQVGFLLFGLNCLQVQVGLNFSSSWLVTCDCENDVECKQTCLWKKNKPSSVFGCTLPHHDFIRWRNVKYKGTGRTSVLVLFMCISWCLCSSWCLTHSLLRHARVRISQDACWRGKYGSKDVILSRVHAARCHIFVWIER